MLFGALAAFSAFWGAAAAVLFRQFAQKAAARQALDHMVAHALELPLFIDEPVVVVRAARDLLVANARLLGAIWLPMAVTVCAFAVLYAPLNEAFGFAPLPANQPAVVTVRANSAEGIELRTSPAVVIETPGVRAAAEQQVSWRVRPHAAGPQEFAVQSGTRVFPVHSSRITRTGDPKVEWIEVPWPPARYFGLPWLAWFALLSVPSALVFSRLRLRWLPRVGVIALLFSAAAQAQTPVILISVDTLRADHLSCYGYKRVQTPNIDSLVHGGTLFREIDSQIPLTLPSHTSLLTSTWPFDNKVEENGALVPPGTITLASILKSHGYSTAAFIGSIALDRRYGLDQGFDVYDSPFESAAGPQNPYSSRVTRDATLVFRAAGQWLAHAAENNVDRNSGHPFFAFIHLYDLHLPYRLPGYSPVEPSVAGYDAELQHVDTALGRFFETLRRDGLWQKAIVVLLSDHGESLGEHGESGHGYFIYESTIHVPLLIHWQAGSAAHPDRVSGPGGLIDVAPTILEALRVKQPATFRGRSLFAGARPVLSESVYARDAFGWAALRSIRTGSKKYIEAPAPELYDLSSDPREMRNVVNASGAEGAQYKQELDARISQSNNRSAHVAAGEQALRSLGYIAGPGAGANTHSNIDPKDRIREFETYTRALGLMYVGRAREAVPVMQEITARDPNNNAIRVDLGHALLDAGRPADAMREWDAILAHNPGFTPASEAEGFYWMEKLDFARAESAFQKTLRVAPRDYEANFAMAIVDEKLGKPLDAARHHQVVCEISPSTPGCRADNSEKR